MYVKVIVDITHEKLDKVFEYSISEELLRMLKDTVHTAETSIGHFLIGTEVVVPFGKGNWETRGYIVGVSETPEYAPEQIKPVLRIENDRRAIESKLVALAAWMKERYGGTMIQSLKTVLPIKKIKQTVKKKRIRLLLSEEEGKKKLDFYLNKNQKARARALAGLLEEQEQEYELFVKRTKASSSVIRALKEQEVLEVTEEEAFRNPVKYNGGGAGMDDSGGIGEACLPACLTAEQQRAVDVFQSDYDKGQRNTYLLYGVTGSGKTEVYMRMIEHITSAGRQAVVLIPEIALTYQTVLRFYRRFGGRVSILNSRLSEGERSDQIERVKKGEVDVMIGPRSALFTPFKNLGLIVIDEEHEAAYKSEQVPRYHARETAVMRGRLEGASVVLGSATPSLEAFYRCERGEYICLTLTERAKNQTLPSVYVEDMREELRKGNRSILSDRLKRLMEKRLKEGQQIMLFLNRRGYAGFISCRSCGYVVKCPHCDVSLSSHKNGRLVCHYCGYEMPAVKSCPSCGSSYIGGFKAGTEAVEELMKREFPEAGILRMDMDTTRTKESHERILSAFSKGEADILVGTQMIVKGHDFPNVTLVGILAADMSLYGNDYRSAERTFELLTQAAGRAGRGSIPGEVVIQTYNPEHYSIERAAEQDYEGFYEKEMEYRRILGYPPAAELLAVLITGREEEQLNVAVRYLKEFALRAGKNKNLQVIGPASPFVGKVKDVYRRVLYLKSVDYRILILMKDHMEQYIEINKGFQKLKIQFDFNPMNIF